MNRGTESATRGTIGRRSGWAALWAFLILASSAAADDSLARYVPADVGLFVELRDGADLLRELLAPEVWITLAEAVGQPSRAEDVELWRAQIEQTLKMKPDQAIGVLLRGRAAFVGEGLGRTQDGVVLCRLVEKINVPDLLRIWNAVTREQAGETTIYDLAGNVGLAVHKQVLLFGDRSQRGGMFSRLARFREGAALNDDPLYAGLLARVPPDPQGLLFARLDSIAPAPTTGPATSISSSTASQPAAGEGAAAPAPASRPGRERTREARANLPGPLRDAHNVLFAMHRQSSLLHFTAVSDSAAPARPPRARAPLLTPRLPERSLAAMETTLDYPALLETLRGLPERNALRVAVELSGSGVLNDLAGALHGRTCIAVGWSAAERNPRNVPPMPAVALLLATSDAATAERQIGLMVNAAAVIYNAGAAQVGQPLLPPAALVELGGVEAHLLDLSEVVGPRSGEFFPEVHFCWALDGEVLILASHIDWLRQLVAARQARGPTLERVLRLPQKSVTDRAETLLVAQTTLISDLSALWLGYLERNEPRVLQEEYWRGRQPGPIRFGIDGSEDRDESKLRVRRVRPGSPCDGLVQPGDVILGVGGTRFSSDRPSRELREMIDRRPQARWVELMIERDGARLTRRIAVPFFYPIQPLRQLVGIGRVAARGIYFDEPPDRTAAVGYLTIELRDAKSPATDFGYSPASRPASRPAELAASQPASAAPRVQPVGATMQPATSPAPDP